MPFKKGVAPVRRTLEYLGAGKLKFHNQTAIFAANYNVDQNASRGTYDFIFWHYPQLAYHNPNVQLLKFKNMTPTPFIQLMMMDGEKFVIDCYDRSREEIHDHLLTTFCEAGYKGKQLKKTIYNPANFGHHCNQWCICEFPGQVPCPSFTPLPKQMRGKYITKMREKGK